MVSRGGFAQWWNPIDDAFNSVLENIANAIAEATTAMFGWVLDTAVDQGASVDWTAPYVRNSYLFAFTLSFVVGLPIILITHLTGVKSRGEGSGEMWDVFLIRLPRWVITSMFGVTLGFLASDFINSLNASIVEYMIGGASDSAAESFEKILLAGLTGTGLPVFLSIVLGTIILLSSLTFFITSLLVTIVAQLLCVLLPLALLSDLTRKHRGIARKYLAVTGVILAAMPVQLFVFGFFLRMVADNMAAGTIVGVVETAAEGESSPLANLGLLTVGSLVMLIPLMAPLAMLNLITSNLQGNIGSGGDSAGSGGAGTPSPSIGSPQQASLASDSGSAGGANAAGSTAGGGASSAAGGASSAGAGAGAGGASSAAAGAGGAAAGAGGAAASAGTAAAAVGAGAATAGVGAVAVAGMAATARIAHGVQGHLSAAANQTAQSASMASMHLDGGEDPR